MFKRIRMGGINIWIYKYGDYVRTDKGIIYKFEEHMKNKQDEEFILCNWGRNVKHSKNIIDLIEVKDVVKFRNKLPNSLEDEEMIIHIFNNDTLEEVKEAINSKEIEIVSIVTKEQFKEAEYEV